MDPFIRTLFAPDRAMTRGKVRKLRILQVTTNEAMNSEVSVRENERGLERLFLVQETIAGKMNPLVLTQLLGNPGNARSLSLDACERRETADTLADIRQFGTHGKTFPLVAGLWSTNGDELLLYSVFHSRSQAMEPSMEPLHLSSEIWWTEPSSANERTQGRCVGRNVHISEILLAYPIWTSSVEGKKRELGGGVPPDTGLARIFCLEEFENGKNKLLPEFP